jgi:hypothetical protein
MGVSAFSLLSNVCLNFYPDNLPKIKQFEWAQDFACADRSLDGWSAPGQRMERRHADMGCRSAGL